MDKVFISNLLVQGVIGIYDYERTILQDIRINATLFTDIRPAAASDQIEDCVDYEKTANLLREHATRSGRFTVEALAEDLAQLCLTIAGVQKVVIRVEKPGAVNFCESVGVEIERNKA